MQVAEEERRVTERSQYAATVGHNEDREQDRVHAVLTFLVGLQEWANQQHGRARRADERGQQAADRQEDRVVTRGRLDVTGQVNAESIGPRQYSGTGGQLEWVVGSQWSKGGKSILALRSSYRDKAGVLHSKIVPQLAPGSVVTTPRTCVQYVVTEYGVADLKYKSTVERARALIAIAHPDFRRELERQMPL